MVGRGGGRGGSLVQVRMSGDSGEAGMAQRGGLRRPGGGGGLFKRGKGAKSQTLDWGL